jgi:chitin disaccharide deacetylase
MDFTNLAPGRKVVVIHEDDVGMTHGSNTAFVELSSLGACSSGSVMPPCPWFPEAVEMAKGDNSLDLGVHLTLTSEKTPYRWRPLTSPSRSAGLTDPLGYFWPDVPNARRADPKAVESELRAQIDASLEAGLDVTHLDAHMGTAMCPEFVDIYVQLGLDYKVPVLLVKDYNTFNPRSYSGPISNDNYDAALARAKSAGFVVFDLVQETMWERKAGAETAYGELFRNLSEGLTFLSLHFNAPGDFEVIEPSHAHIRTDEYALFKSCKITEWAKANDVEIVGMRAMRDDLRSRWGDRADVMTPAE